MKQAENVIMHFILLLIKMFLKKIGKKEIVIGIKEQIKMRVMLNVIEN